MVKQIKAQKPNCKLIVGGAGFSIFAEEIMKENAEIDFGVLSEGENSFHSLLTAGEHAEKIPNIIYRKNGKTITTEKKSVNFESLPFPSRDLFEVKKYNNASYSIGVQSKRGCPFNCVFCSKRIQGGGSCKLRSPKNVVDEIETLVNDFGARSFFFVDSTFNFPVEHCREICEEIIKRKLQLRWSADFRPDYLNENIVRSFVKAGCTWFGFSPNPQFGQAAGAWN